MVRTKGKGKLAKGKAKASRQVARILIVDDHPLVVHALTELISREPDLEICGQASEAGEALKQLDATKPDLIIIDISLKRGDGVELIKQIKARQGEAKMLVSSMHSESLFAERTVRAGAMGYVNKQEEISKLIEAIRQVLDGQIYLSPGMANRLLSRMVAGRRAIERSPIETLSDRELEVFGLIGQGLTTGQIAKKLQISVKTVETYRENIKAKLNLASGAELSHQAVQWVMENS